VPDRVFAVQVKQQEWCQQEQSLKSIEQALNQFQVQENKLQRTVSELQALQHTTAQRVSSLLHLAYNMLLNVDTFMHCVRATGFAAHNSTAGEFIYSMLTTCHSP